jgi:protein-disulfide isomerase
MIFATFQDACLSPRFASRILRNSSQTLEVSLRIFSLIALLALSIYAPTTGVAENLPLADALNDRVLGNPSAPITIVEYSSLTCPNCRSFHQDVFPELMKAYIKTGKAKLVFRDFPLDGLALRASMMARCAPTDRYFKYIDVLYRTQSTWATESDPLIALARVGKLGGMNQTDFDACMQNEALFDGILRSRQVASVEFSIEGTPTFIINGKKMTQPATFESFDSILKKLTP